MFKKTSCARRLFSTRFCQTTQHRPPHPVKHSRILSFTRTSWPRPRYLTTRAAAIKLFKENPFSVSLASFIIICGAGGILFANYVYYYYIIKQFEAFPEPVAIKLRRAVFYSKVSVQPNNAIRYFNQALQIADEMGMDPFSEAIIGVKTNMAFFMERIHHPEQAIEILEIVQSDCLKWIDLLGQKEGNEGKRTRVLGKTVAIGVKLAELYSSNAIDDIDTAQEKLVYVVTAVMKEKKRREEEGVKEGEGPWVTNEEMGQSHEALGNLYERQNLHYLAAPLYLNALTLLPQTDCHSVVLMNNLSLSLLLQKPPREPFLPPASAAVMLDNATQWARKAVALAESIQDPALRTQECDHGCATAMVNLGELARRAGDEGGARDWLSRGEKLSREVGFEEGIRMAEEGLRELDGVD